MYIIYKKSYALNEITLFGFLYFQVFPWPWKLTFRERLNELVFVSSVTCINFFFLLDTSFSPLLMMRKREKSILQVFFQDFTYIWQENFGDSWTKLTLDNLNTQKTGLHTNPCWRHSKNQTISLVPSEQNLYIP